MKKVMMSMGIALVVATPAYAKLEIKPVAGPAQIVRFNQGVPEIEEDLPDQQAAVRIVPLPGLDHGSLTFKVAVYNKSRQAMNVGVENIAFSYGANRLPVFTKAQVESKAKKRAMWSQIGYAMLAGAAAAAQNNNTTVTTYAPSGRIYRTVIERPGLSDGQVAAVAAGGGAIALSQVGLNKTLEMLNDEYIQTTTLDPDSGYGGRIICSKLKNAKIGELVALAVEVNGERHLFKFRVERV
ncbi:hypothetical protein D9601_16185 [Sphingomonas sp. MA1305]|uniref:hypothetical protein n=1 Tax=Sphingomonas sp. MA1305 TaxID=2479204 RepID=UPI0018E045BE|nr:hypothetical protein [Sphingomonas sp. MA1305]MBI0476892.1 hypothetical protein [Sphingomonas sp. MA1305]